MRERLPILEVAAALGAIQRNLIGSEYDAGERIPRICHAGHIAPGICRIAGVHANRVAMYAANRFANNLLAGRPSVVTENKLIGSESDRFAESVGFKSFGKRRRNRGGR